MPRWRLHAPTIRIGWLYTTMARIVQGAIRAYRASAQPCSAVCMRKGRYLERVHRALPHTPPRAHFDGRTAQLCGLPASCAGRWRCLHACIARDSKRGDQRFMLDYGTTQCCALRVWTRFSESEVWSQQTRWHTASLQGVTMEASKEEESHAYARARTGMPRGVCPTLPHVNVSRQRAQ